MKSDAIVSGTSRSFSDYVLESSAVVGLAMIMSRILGEEVTSRQALHLLHAQVSFVALLLLCGIGLFACVLLLAWFVLSVWHCAQQF